MLTWRNKAVNFDTFSLACFRSFKVCGTYQQWRLRSLPEPGTLSPTSAQWCTGHWWPDCSQCWQTWSRLSSLGNHTVCPLWFLLCRQRTWPGCYWSGPPRSCLAWWNLGACRGWPCESEGRIRKKCKIAIHKSCSPVKIVSYYEIYLHTCFHLHPANYDQLRESF